jgi:predicted Zn-dependent protease with MMP-like domain
MKIETEIMLQALRRILDEGSQPTRIAVVLYALLSECAINDEAIVQVAVQMANLVS